MHAHERRSRHRRGLAPAEQLLERPDRERFDEQLLGLAQRERLGVRGGRPSEAQSVRAPDAAARKRASRATADRAIACRRERRAAGAPQPADGVDRASPARPPGRPVPDARQRQATTRLRARVAEEPRAPAGARPLDREDLRARRRRGRAPPRRAAPAAPVARPPARRLPRRSRASSCRSRARLRARAQRARLPHARGTHGFAEARAPAPRAPSRWHRLSYPGLPSHRGVSVRSSERRASGDRGRPVAGYLAG